MDKTEDEMKEVARKKIQSLKDCYKQYAQCGGKASFDDFTTIFLIRDLEFQDYQRLLDHVRGLIGPTLEGAATALSLAAWVASKWENNSAEDMAVLQEAQDTLRERLKTFSAGANYPPGKKE